MVDELVKRGRAADEAFLRDRREMVAAIDSQHSTPSAKALDLLLRMPEERAARRNEQLEAGVWKAEVAATREKEEQGKQKAGNKRREQAGAARREDVERKLLPVIRELKASLGREPKAGEVREVYL